MRGLLACLPILCLLCCGDGNHRAKCKAVNCHYLENNTSRWVIRENDKYGYIDKEGKIIISCQLDTACEFINDIALVKRKGRFFYIDTNGAKIFDKTFEVATPFFTKGYAAVQVAGKWGVIDLSGQFVVPPSYDRLMGYESDQYLWSPFFPGTPDLPRLPETDSLKWLGAVYERQLAAVSESGKWGLWSLVKNEYVIRPEMDQFSLWSEGMISVKKNGKWGLCDSTGKMITEFIYDHAFMFSEGRAIVCRDPVCGCIDRTGKEVITPRYRLFRSYSDGLAARMTYGDQMYRFIDTAGNLAFRDSFDNVTDYCHGVALVSKGNDWWLIDKQGKTVTGEKYDETFLFNENGTTVVGRNGMYGMINVCGEEIVPIRYDEINGIIGGMAEVRLGRKWGFIDMETGNVIIPRYDKILTSFGNGVAMVVVHEGGKEVYQYINKRGDVLWSGT